MDNKTKKDHEIEEDNLCNSFDVDDIEHGLIQDQMIKNRKDIRKEY